MATSVSPIKVRTSVKGFQGKSKNYIEAFKRHMQQAHRKTISQAKTIVRRNIKTTGAIATENLLNSVSDRVVENNSTNSHTNALYFSGSASRYAGFAEYGRKKGKNPPPSAIADWMRAKGYNLKNLYWVVINIGKKGTKGHYFLRKSRPEIREAQKRIFERAREEFRGRFG